MRATRKMGRNGKSGNHFGKNRRKGIQKESQSNFHCTIRLNSMRGGGSGLLRLPVAVPSAGLAVLALGPKGGQR